MKAFLALKLCAGILFSHTVAALPFGSPLQRDFFDKSNNIAVYWGQNSYGTESGPLSQQRLVHYCANSNIDIIPIAFLTEFTTTVGGNLRLNFANQESSCTLFPGTGLVNCATIGSDIKKCQQVYGKKILLSLGGSTFSGGFSGPGEAATAAKLLMDTFGPVHGVNSNGRNLTVPHPTNPVFNSTSNGVPLGAAGRSGFGQNSNWTAATLQSHIKPRQNGNILRPFGDAVVDGFDLDLESDVQFAVPFARTLRSLMDASNTKRFFLTAAPQCPQYGNSNERLLNSDVHLDAVFVQFYNNYCGVQSFSPGASSQLDFNFDSWNEWAAPRNTKVFLGVPAGPSAASTGYATVDELQSIVKYCKHYKTFGGVMMWDASQAAANRGFVPGIKQILG